MPPPLAGQEKQNSGPTIEVVVRIGKDDRYVVGDRTVSKKELAELLKEAGMVPERMNAENNMTMLRIIDEGASSYAILTEVMKLATEAGVKSISFGPKQAVD